MLCKWQVKKLCIFYIQISNRDGGVGAEGLTDRTGSLNYHQALWSFLIDHITFHPHCHSISTFLSPSPTLPAHSPLFVLSSLLLVVIIVIFNISTSSTVQKKKGTALPGVARTWPQFVNILPLDHPLCWYNDHLTVRSKARRKLGRRQQRGQQHWSNYVSLSPSILTLMKSLIVRRRGRWGGEDRCTKCTLFIYLILWNERKERRE